MKYAFSILILVSASTAYAQPVYRCINNQRQLSFRSEACTNVQTNSFSLKSGQRSTTESLKPVAYGVGPLQATDEARDKVYLDSKKRCQGALVVANICGRFAGMFTCGEHGFQHEELDKAGKIKLSFIKSINKIKMQQCAEQISE